MRITILRVMMVTSITLIKNVITITTKAMIILIIHTY
jgi:hypothetical protein